MQPLEGAARTAWRRRAPRSPGPPPPRRWSVARSAAGPGPRGRSASMPSSASRSRTFDLRPRRRRPGPGGVAAQVGRAVPPTWRRATRPAVVRATSRPASRMLRAEVVAVDFQQLVADDPPQPQEHARRAPEVVLAVVRRLQIGLLDDVGGVHPPPQPRVQPERDHPRQPVIVPQSEGAPGLASPRRPRASSASASDGSAAVCGLIRSKLRRWAHLRQERAPAFHCPIEGRHSVRECQLVL